jgi:glycosyltransferase involved in cell wall biosynthesis
MNPYAFMSRLRRELQSRPAFDAVHAHVGSFGGPALSVAKALGIPVRIAHYHNLASGHKNDWKRRLYETWLRQMVLQCSTGIAACSWHALKAHFPQLWASDPRMLVIRNGALPQGSTPAALRRDARAELGIPLDAPVIGHVGRFAWQKNHVGLIDAMPHILKRVPAARLLLVGDGKLRPEIEQRIAQHGVGANVVLAGLRRDVPRMLAAMDVFAFPSVCEAFGLAAIEAQSAGVPVAGADAMGIREALAPAFHPYCFDPQNASSVADSVLSLLSASRGGRLAAEARAFGQRFAVEHTVQAMMASYGAPGAEVPADPSAWAAPLARRSVRSAERVERPLVAVPAAA